MLVGLEYIVPLGSVSPGGITISNTIEDSLKVECPRLLSLSEFFFDEVGETYPNVPEVDAELGGALIGGLRRPDCLDAGVMGETWGLSEMGVGGRGRSKSSGLGQGDCGRDDWFELRESSPADEVIIVSTLGVLDPPSLLLLLVRILVDT